MAATETRRLCYAKRWLSDLDACDIPISDAGYPYHEVDFSQNQLSQRGLQQVLSICARCHDLRVLKLYKNRLGDDCAALLAEMFRHCETVREVHLSHNRLTRVGVETIVEAAVRSRQKGAAPLWLRLEHNNVECEQEILSAMEERCGVCPRRPGCTQFTCCVGSRVHLPFLDVAREKWERRTGDWSRILLRPKSPARVALVPAKRATADDSRSCSRAGDSRSPNGTADDSRSCSRAGGSRSPRRERRGNRRPPEKPAAAAAKSRDRRRRRSRKSPLRTRLDQSSGALRRRRRRPPEEPAAAAAKTRDRRRRRSSKSPLRTRLVARPSSPPLHDQSSGALDRERRSAREQQLRTRLLAIGALHRRRSRSRGRDPVETSIVKGVIAPELQVPGHPEMASLKGRLDRLLGPLL